jgi:hypothetical protein
VVRNVVRRCGAKVWCEGGVRRWGTKVGNEGGERRGGGTKVILIWKHRSM